MRRDARGPNQGFNGLVILEKLVVTPKSPTAKNQSPREEKMSGESVGHSSSLLNL